MQQKLTWGILIIAIAVGVWYFTQKPVETEMPSEEQMPAAGSVGQLSDGVYALDVTESSITWTGSKTLIKEYIDTGTLSFTDGSVTVSDGAIVAGAFTIDMKSFAVTTTGSGKGNDALANHLKSADFFDVAQYPVAVVGIRDITDGAVTADVTIKGITKQVSFPATVAQDGDVLTATADLTIDRTVWDIRYGSSKFFGDLGDNVIGDSVTLSLSLVARVAQ